MGRTVLRTAVVVVENADDCEAMPMAALAAAALFCR